MADKTQGEIPIRVGDIQNPLGILDMMWETADFYCSLLEESDAVHKALEIITEVEIEYIHEMYKIIVLEEPAFRYQSLSVNKSIEQIYQNRYQKYEALNAGRTDNVGVMDCMFGTHILPCLFGGEERVFADGHTYLEGPIIFSPEDVYKLKVNDIKTGVIGRQIEILKYMADKTQGEIPIRVGDIQNPLGILDMMWETADFYCSLLEESDAVHKALEIITEVEIEYIHEMYKIIVLEEPAFRYQSLSVNKSIEQIYQNRYQKYEALNAGRTDNVGVMDCMFGTHILPCLFGGEERVFADGHTYLEGPIIFSPEDVYKLLTSSIHRACEEKSVNADLL